jgi:hypothetical protein
VKALRLTAEARIDRVTITLSPAWKNAQYERRYAKPLSSGQIAPFSDSHSLYYRMRPQMREIT